MNTIKHSDRFRTATRYAVLRPMGAGTFGIVTEHRALSAAERSLARQERGARKQGGYCQDYLAEVTR